MGEPGEGPGGILPVCPGRRHRHRQAAVRGTQGFGHRDLELPRRWRPDAVHHDLSLGAGGVQGRGRSQEGQTDDESGETGRGNGETGSRDDEARRKDRRAPNAGVEDLEAGRRSAGRPADAQEVRREDREGGQYHRGCEKDGRARGERGVDRSEDGIPPKQIVCQIGLEGASAIGGRRGEEDRPVQAVHGSGADRASSTDRMPFLRFSRDRRGYESTYLCHTFRRGGTSQLRVLYWFRSPPDVKVGRLALDPGAIRAIEESNPDLKFDWSKILKVTPPPLPPDHGRDGREERRARRRRGRDTDTASTPSALNAIPAGDQAETPESAVAVESEREPDHLDPATHRPEPASGVWADLDPNGESDTQAEGPPAHVVLGLTDEQGLARLRARHGRDPGSDRRPGQGAGDAGAVARPGVTAGSRCVALGRRGARATGVA